MSKHRFLFGQSIGRGLVITSSAGASLAALAQEAGGSCAISLGYGPLIQTGASTAVPSIGTLGVLVLSAVVAGAGLVKFKSMRGKTWMAASLAATAALVMSQSDGLIREARAAIAYVFENPSGGVVSNTALPYSVSPELITLTNTSGVPMRIVSNGNPSDTGTCIVGATIAAGASCTSLPVCTAPPLLQIDVATPPEISCGSEFIFLAPLGLPTSTSTPGAVYGNGMRMAQAPSFLPDSPAPSVTFTQTPYPPIRANSQSVPTHLAEDSITTGTVIATAPSGYGFGSGLESTLTWQSSLNCTIVTDGTQNPEPPQE